MAKSAGKGDRAAEMSSHRTDEPVASKTVPQLAESVAASGVQITSLRFLRISCETSDEAFSELPKTVDVRIGFTRPNVKRSGRQFAVTCEFRFKVIAELASGKDPFELRAMTEILYEQPEDREYLAEELSAFAELNGPFNAWPYWRELVHNGLVRLGLPLLRLPLVLAGQLSAFQIPDDTETNPEQK